MPTQEEQTRGIAIAVRLMGIFLERTYPGTMANLLNAVPMHTLTPGTQETLREVLSGS